MLSVFFDLETSDRHPIGQILNFCFVALDDRWQEHASLSGDVRLSCLELPRAEALLANRIDVLKHQAAAAFSESEAMRAIAEFFEGLLNEQAGSIVLIGYNSSRFDVPFLRTSLIRNGINPYFGGRVVYRDLLHAVRCASCRRADFPQPRHAERADTLCLTLERVAQELGLLDGAQQHDSRFDVDLTIKLARCLCERFQLDPRRYEAYEAPRRTARGATLWQLSPNYDAGESARTKVVPMLLLDDSQRYALWVDLERYRAGEGRRSICWYNKGMGAFPLAEQAPVEGELQQAAEDARREFACVTLQNFFEPSTCDIEQDIYRLDCAAIEALGQAIWAGDPRALQRLDSRDARVIYRRHELRCHDWRREPNARLREMLRQYALYRYGGRLQLRKVLAEDEGAEDFHPSFRQLLAEIEARAAAAGPADKAILTALKRYYHESEIYRLAGEELTGAPCAA